MRITRCYILPFLKPKTVAGLIITKRKPDGDMQESHSEGNEDAGIKAAAADLIRAIHAKDEDSVVSALKAAFEMMEQKPNEEPAEMPAGE